MLIPAGLSHKLETHTVRLRGLQAELGGVRIQSQHTKEVAKVVSSADHGRRRGRSMRVVHCDPQPQAVGWGRSGQQQLREKQRQHFGKWQERSSWWTW